MGGEIAKQILCTALEFPQFSCTLFWQSNLQKKHESGLDVQRTTKTYKTINRDSNPDIQDVLNYENLNFSIKKISIWESLTNTF